MRTFIVAITAALVAAMPSIMPANAEVPADATIALTLTESARQVLAQRNARFMTGSDGNVMALVTDQYWIGPDDCTSQDCLISARVMMTFRPKRPYEDVTEAEAAKSIAKAQRRNPEIRRRVTRIGDHVFELADIPAEPPRDVDRTIHLSGHMQGIAYIVGLSVQPGSRAEALLDQALASASLDPLVAQRLFERYDALARAASSVDAMQTNLGRLPLPDGNRAVLKEIVTMDARRALDVEGTFHRMDFLLNDHVDVSVACLPRPIEAGAARRTFIERTLSHPNLSAGERIATLESEGNEIHHYRFSRAAFPRGSVPAEAWFRFDVDSVMVLSASGAKEGVLNGTLVPAFADADRRCEPLAP